MTTIKTDIIRNSASSYMSHLTLSWVGKWWWAIIIPILTPVTLGMATGNIAWYLTALMITFLCFPSIMLFVFNQYALRPQARRAIYPHIIEINPDRLTATFIQSEDEDILPPEPIAINLKDIKEMSIGGKGIILSWNNTPYDFISIPFSSFASKEDSVTAIQWIRDAMPSKWDNLRS